MKNMCKTQNSYKNIYHGKCCSTLLMHGFLILALSQIIMLKFSFVLPY